MIKDLLLDLQVLYHFSVVEEIGNPMFLTKNKANTFIGRIKRRRRKRDNTERGEEDTTNAHHECCYEGCVLEELREYCE